MQFVTRLASQPNQYPLPVHGEAAWQSAADGHWRAEIKLTQLSKDMLIVPSLCVLEADATYQFVLHVDDAAYPLNPVPAAVQDQPKPAHAEQVSCHIDCWHIHQRLDQAHISVTLHAPHAPQRYLLTVSTRRLELETAPAAVPLPPTESISVDVPQDISQMAAAQNIRARICSPTALSMAMSTFTQNVDWPAAVEACYDPLTKAYGAWPLAIRHAASHGITAAVECFDDWSSPVKVLQAGYPLICSIRFGKDQLSGAPLPQSGGHLVVLYGLDHEHVLVKDPAAAEAAEVPRRYLATQFSRAWLHRRGAAYILAPS